jgi:hypothetical protein
MLLYCSPGVSGVRHQQFARVTCELYYYRFPPPTQAGLQQLRSTP